MKDYKETLTYEEEYKMVQRQYERDIRLLKYCVYFILFFFSFGITQTIFAKEVKSNFNVGARIFYNCSIKESLQVTYNKYCLNNNLKYYQKKEEKYIYIVYEY